MTVLISLEQVSRDFDGGRIVALRDVNLVVAKAESVAIVGASGSGKTTLIMLMCGIMLPSAGVIRWRDTLVATPQAWTRLRRTEIGIVFQDFNLFPTLTAVENVEVPMLGTLNHGCERKRRANDVLEAVGLGERGYHLPHELSGGERQRVAIARSLVNHPTLLLADEPIGNLDSISGTAVMDLLFDLQRSQGVTLVLVTHDASHARRCRQQIQIQDGRVFEKAQQEVTFRPGAVTYLSVRLAHPQDPAEIDRISNAIAAIGGLSASKSEDLLRNDSMVGLLRAVSSSMAWVALLMGTLMVLNTLLMAVLERTREIGILSAIGWAPERIMGVLMLEGLILSAIGSAAGISIGVGAAYLLGTIPAIGRYVAVQPTIGLVLASALAAIGLGLFGSSYPAWRATRQSPATALGRG